VTDGTGALAWAIMASERLYELFDEFGIAQPSGDEHPGVWFDLAMRLMVEREPTLAPFVNKGGAPVQPQTVAKDLLILLALGPGRERGKSVTAAAAHLAKRQRFKGMSAGYIRKRFYALLKPGSPEGIRARKQLEYMQKNL
jgi:hypothetical protein